MDSYLSLINLSTLPPMIYQPVDNIPFYIIIAAFLEAVAVYAWRYNTMTVARLVTISLALRAAWLLALVLFTVSARMEDKLFWVTIQQLCVIGQFPMFPLLIISFARPTRFTKKITVVVLLLTAAFALLLVTSGWHDWFRRGVLWDGTTFGIIRGPGHWISTILGYLIALACMVFWANMARKASGLRRWQILVLPADFLFSAFGHFQWIIDQKADIISPLPVGFLLSGLAWVCFLFSLRLFNLIPLAQAAVTRDMNDSFIVIDDQSYIVELNPAARKLAGERRPELIGSRFPAVFAAWPPLVELAACREAAMSEVCLESGGNPAYYQIRVVPLTGWHGWHLGKAIVLHDISEQKKAQMRNLEQQKALSIIMERERLGRELHDGEGQHWSYINMQVEAACLLLMQNEPEQAHKLLQRLAEVVRSVHVDIRESITGLRTEMSVEKGIWQPVAEYIEWFRQNSDINVEFIVDKGFTAGSLAPTSKAQLLRIIQEALTNIRKHAGARNVKVVVRRQGETVEIRVEDDGRGFDVALAMEKKGCYGIGIMKERAEETGARLMIESTPRVGTAVVILASLDKG